MHHFHFHSIGPNLVTWPYLAAKEIGKCSFQIWEMQQPCSQILSIRILIIQHQNSLTTSTHPRLERVQKVCELKTCFTCGQGEQPPRGCIEDPGSSPFFICTTQLLFAWIPEWERVLTRDKADLPSKSHHHIYLFLLFQVVDWVFIMSYYSLLWYVKFLCAPAPCCYNLRMEGRERAEGLTTFLLKFLIMQNSQ